MNYANDQSYSYVLPNKNALLFLNSIESQELSKLSDTYAEKFDRDRELRLKAAWLYYGHGLTQADVAKSLDVSRSTVLRMLEDVRQRRELRFWIEGGPQSTEAISTELEAVAGITEVTLVPSSDDLDGCTRAVGIALGRKLTDLVSDGAVIGAGWGRTLSASLRSFAPRRLPKVRVISLLGGSSDQHSVNTSEFAWRFADLMGAQCYLFPAPVIVDSPETKTALLERCGLDNIQMMAQALEIAVVSVGDIGPTGTSLARKLLAEPDYASLVRGGAVADILCNFIDAEGRDVDNPISQRTMTTSLTHLEAAQTRILAAAGTQRSVALVAAIKRLRPTHLVADAALAAEAITLLKA